MNNTTSTQPVQTTDDHRRQVAESGARSLLALYWAIVYLAWGIKKPKRGER